MPFLQSTDLSRLLSARDWLASGKLVAIPTETVYGLAAIASDEAAIRRVFELKARPFFDPLIVHIGEWSQLDDLVENLSPAEEFLLRKFWPGPLTLVTKKRPEVSALITSGHDTVAVRMPKHPLALELIRLLGEPVVAPSANQFGRTSPTTAEHVAAEFQAEDLLILDGGSCEVGIESTVIQVESGRVLLLRPGGISREDLDSALAEGGFSLKVERAESERSPGHLKHHYQPKTPLVLCGEVPSGEKLSSMLGREIVSVKEIHLDRDPIIAARLLYKLLREADRESPGAIVLRWNAPKAGLWEAIWDRVQRAATVVEGL